MLERQKIEQGIDKALELLLDRPIFAWPDRKSKTLRELIFETAQTYAFKKLEEIKDNSSLTTNQIISRIQGRTESWGYNDCLDHTKLSAI